MDKLINNAIVAFQQKLSAKYGHDNSLTVQGVRELNALLKNSKTRFEIIANEEKLSKEYGV